MLLFPDRRWISCLFSALILLIAGCSADRAWRAAEAADTGPAYARFLRDHPESRHGIVAQERLQYEKIRSEPSLGAYAEFDERYPESERLPALLTSLEPAN